MKRNDLIILSSLFLLASVSLYAGNGKKVYADYHGVRYTRKHDGMLGRWAYYADTGQSKTGKKTLCYNADNISDNGRHEIASVAYPQVGMHSNLDPDYIEYQILSAKTAKIDGFFIEWGFTGHENDVLLKAMQHVAAKYDFEIGVNWCDGWLYYDWITKRQPEINTREKKTAYYVQCYQYLIDSVFSATTAPIVKGQPVFYLFGPGATPEEYEWIYRQLDIPESMKAPVPLRRWAEWGKLENDVYIPVTESKEIDLWKKSGAVPTAWLPARVRPLDGLYPYWDHYATQDDVIEFMKPFRDLIWNNEESGYRIKSGFVMPGMDNRGCAGWGRSHFFYIPRAEGETYRKMWEFNLESKDKLDMVFIASWSDYTEGHEIEPTIENGNRELKTTLKYAAQFKNETPDEKGLDLPLRLFMAKKQWKFLLACGFETSLFPKKEMDDAALLIGKGKYADANARLKNIESELKKINQKISEEKIELNASDIKIEGVQEQGQYNLKKGVSIYLDQTTCDKLDHNYYEGYINFEYFDDGFQNILLTSQTDKKPKHLFEVIASIKKDNTKKWKTARVKLFKENISYRQGKASYKFSGDGSIKNIALDYAIYNQKNRKEEIRRTAKGVVFSVKGVQYNLEFYSPGIVRVLSHPEHEALTTKRLVVDKYKPAYQDFKIIKDKHGYTFTTDSITVCYNKKDNAFSFYETFTGAVLLREKPKQARLFRRTKVAGESCFNVIQRFIPTSQEALYGLGQYQDGVMNYRNNTVLLLQANMDIVNPFLISTNRYGLLWDNYSSTTFKDDSDGYAFNSEVGDASDYYFVFGKNMDEVVRGYRKLTGDVPMFAKWAFGLWQSKERYKSFQEVEQVVSEYRKRNIPLDNIVQDWEYWGDKSHWNALDFDSLTFPNACEEIEKLQNNYHVKYMISVWPGFGPQTAVYKELEQAGALFDEPTWAGYKVFDTYNPQARDIFWKHLKNGLYDKGVDAWWMDATEPSFKEGFTQRKQEEKTKSAGQTYMGSFHRYLNVYSLELSKFLSEKLRKENDEKRVFILTRSAFASQQRYATAVWSGDVPASWENMHKQITAGLNLSVSGIPYWTSDIGGFFVTERGGNYPEGLKDDEYKELYTRWFQFGAFSPLFRAHGTNVPREIWQFGDIGSPYYDTQLKYIKLRYRLIPYIYSLSHQVSVNGYTLMRPLVMDFGHDVNTHEIDNAYMFGDALLVRPVLTPESASNLTATYLPEHDASYWFNFWTNETIQGGQTDTIPTPIHIMPLYVKGGSILPLSKREKQYTTEAPDDKLEIRIYGGSDASFLWYDDEGDSYRYENGENAETKIEWKEAEKKLILSGRNGRYKNMPDTVTFFIKLYLPGENPVEKEIKYTGENISFIF